MARREDFLTPETLAAADEVDQMLAGMTPTSSYQEPVPSVHVNDAIEDPLPAPTFIDLFQVMADASDPSTLPPVLLEGILHKGCKMILSGSSKAGKTLGLMHLGIAAASRQSSHQKKGENPFGHNDGHRADPPAWASSVTGLLFNNRPGLCLIWRENSNILRDMPSRFSLMASIRRAKLSTT